MNSETKQVMQQLVKLLSAVLNDEIKVEMLMTYQEQKEQKRKYGTTEVIEIGPYAIIPRKYV